MASLHAWLKLAAFIRWARCEDSASFPRKRCHTWHEPKGIGFACLLTRTLCRPEVVDDEEVRRWLDSVISKVEKLVSRGNKSASAMWAKLVSSACSASRRSRGKKLRRWRLDNRPKTPRPARRAFVDGSKADGWGNWSVAQIRAVRGSPSVGFQVLVRWTGPHEDSWCLLNNLSKDLKKTALTWIRSTLGFPPRPRRPFYAPPHSSRSRFRRLVRGTDAVGQVGVPPSLVG